MLYDGMIKTIEDDGSIKRWYVCFEALSLEDAESIAEIMNVSDLAIAIAWIDYDTDGPQDIVPAFCAWHYRDGRMINEE